MLVGTPAQTIAVVLAGHARHLLPELAAAECRVVQPPDLQFPTLPWSRRHWGRVGQKCMSELSGNAQFFGCFLFEDSAGRAEDARTGLSCPARQAKLASQCQARCSAFAANFQVCSDPNSQWQRFFGDIGGLAFGSARVDLCGPRLASGYRPFPSYRDRGWNSR